MTLLRTVLLAGGLTATALSSASPALADRPYRHGGDTTGAAIAGGIVGLAVGAAVASAARRDRYDDGYRGHPHVRTYYAYRAYPPRAYGRDWERYRWERERWERERWERRRWQYRDWDRGYRHHHHWDGPGGW